MEVAIDLIKPSPYQPRLTFHVEDLKEEIQCDGLLSALVVRKRDEYYELLDGERRLRALKELDWKAVPIDIREVSDEIARRSVYKLNKIRENYETKDEATYFKKLSDEGMKPYQIETELGAEHAWVQACLNIWKFPEDVRREVFSPRGTTHYLFMTDIRALEGIINRNPEQAIGIARQIIRERLNEAEKRKLISGRAATIDEARVKAAQEALPEFIPTLETPEDMEKAAEALKREAQRQREEAMTPEEKAALEAERKARIEAEAAIKAQRAEERKQQRAEQERQREEQIAKRVKKQFLEDRSFLGEVLDSAPRDLIEEKRLEKLLFQSREVTPLEKWQKAKHEDVLYKLDLLGIINSSKGMTSEKISALTSEQKADVYRTCEEAITEIRRVMDIVKLIIEPEYLLKGG